MKRLSVKGQLEYDKFDEKSFAVWFRTDKGNLLFLGAKLWTTGEFLCEDVLKKLEIIGETKILAGSE
jgi:hypothetical protein